VYNIVKTLLSNLMVYIVHSRDFSVFVVDLLISCTTPLPVSLLFIMISNLCLFVNF